MKQIHIIAIILTIFVVLFTGCISTNQKKKSNGPVKVELKDENGSFSLYCDGQPFYIKGAGINEGNIEALARNGGNAFRTWSPDNRLRTGKETLDAAYQNGLMVCMGLEIARERHGFNYDDTVAVKAQFERVKQDVLKYKDHPALLAWGIGNELNLSYTNPKVWDAVNDIAGMIHRIDPNHPTTTMFAGAGKSEIGYIQQRCPEIDFLSFQLYGDILNLPTYIARSGWKGAYVVSEWGATGHWEVQQTAWGRPIEQNSHIKAMAYKERYEKVIADDPRQCIGSFVFLWGQKQERTSTWYGMFLEDGSETETVDVMYFLWNGKWPENRAPRLDQFFLDGKTAYENVYLEPGHPYTAFAQVTDPEGDPLKYKWEIIAEVPENQQSEGGDFEQKPVTVLSFPSGEKNESIGFEAPSAEGEYRIFVYAYDGKNKAATANIPFYVKKK